MLTTVNETFNDPVDGNVNDSVIINIQTESVNDTVDMLSAQIKLEEAMKADAAVRRDRHVATYNKHLNFSESNIGKPFVKSATIAFQEAVEAFVNAPTGKGKKGSKAATLLKATGLDSGTISYLFVKAVYNLLATTHRRRAKRATFVIRASDLIHDEYRLQFFAQAKERKHLLKKLCKDFDKKSYPRHTRKRTIQRYFDAEQLEWTAWTQSDKQHVGWALTLLFRDSTNLIHAASDDTYVDPTPELVDAIQKMMADRVLDFQVFSPMVYPPKPWSESNLFGGGYYTNNVRRYPLVKGTKKRDIERLLSMGLDQIIPAVNALQETPWRVNLGILDVLDWIVNDRAGGVAGLPSSQDIPPPKEPPGYAEMADDHPDKKAHKKACFENISDNRKEVSKRLMLTQTVLVAKAMEDYDAIYFPHNLDSRGRAYPLPSFLNPQGPDYAKALLEFAEGKPIENEEQGAWLAIAGANAYGNDKVSLQERVDWVCDNEELIFATADDPKGDVRWMSVSDPFQFLRFCWEWAGFRQQGFGYVCHMPVPVDATCSGLQHYSAMLRDEVGGRSVNLVPDLPRQDIYGDVARRTTEKLTQDLESEDYLDEEKTILKATAAKDWLDFGVNRSMTKRQVMVVPYAGTFASCMEYTREAVKEKVKEGHPIGFSLKGEGYSARAVYLAHLIWDSIDEVVIKGKEAMRWLTSVATAYTKYINAKSDKDTPAFDRRMTWKTPDGFEVSHCKPKQVEQRVDTYLDGRVSLVHYVNQNVLDGKEMAQSLAPNFVHSLDAALLRMAVIRGLKRGLRHFAMVHDSFGVHPSDMPVFLDECIKPAFVEMYKDSPLEAFKSGLPSDLEVSELPEQGLLVLEDVLRSEFFFS